MAKRAGLTKKQLELRKTGIGASEIPVLAGLSKYGSAADVWAAKLGAVKERSLAMRLGTLTEDPIAELYAEETGRHLARVTTLRHPEDPIILATPDRAVHVTPLRRGADPVKGAERLLQVKHSTMRLRSLWGRPGTDEVPEDHLAQVTQEMGVSGVHTCDVAVLFDKDELAIFTVHFSRDLFENLRAIARHFWEAHVLAKVAPPAEASERYRDALTALWPGQKSDRLTAATPELEALAYRLRVLEALEKEAGRRGELIRNELRRYIGEDTGVLTRAGTITWKKNPDGKKTDWQAVAHGFLELAVAGHLPPSAVERRGTFMLLVAQHTKEVQGPRVLRKSWTKTLPSASEDPAFRALPEVPELEKSPSPAQLAENAGPVVL